ncbi:MAG: nucleoside recognition protein, partial [Ignavibacteriae bacterium]|nr:nucleoside recognition protein [Ignavibacteriota bacterium]
MLNYVWLALIMLGIGVAITTDVFEKSENKYQNGNQLKVEIILQDSTKDVQQGKNSVLIKIPKERFNDFYKT